jgi:hypothetical protein
VWRRPPCRTVLSFQKATAGLSVASCPASHVHVRPTEPLLLLQNLAVYTGLRICCAADSGRVLFHPVLALTESWLSATLDTSMASPSPGCEGPKAERVALHLSCCEVSLCRLSCAMSSPHSGSILSMTFLLHCLHSSSAP